MEKKLYLGRNRPIAHCKKLRLENYLTTVLPSLPSSCDYTKESEKALSQMYLNDQLGDCVIAGIAHIEGLLTGQTGSPVIYTNEEIITLYSAIGGYVPGDPSTDNGCDEETALNYWENYGAPKGSHKITNWLSVNSSNQDEVKAAMWLFENLVFGIELPDEWINPFPSKSGFVWKQEGPADPNNGHCVIGCGYNGTGVQICTWGMIGTITWGAINEYISKSDGGQLFVVLSEDSIEKAIEKSASGLDWTQLQVDFKSLTSEK